MATIQGKYNLFAILKAGYTLTGNDRAGTFAVSTDGELNVKCATAPSYADTVVLNVENEIKIKKIRLVPNGAPGIKAGLSHFAGEFNLQAVTDDGEGNIDVYDETFVHVMQWSEWLDVNFTLKPFKRKDNGDAEFVGLMVPVANSVFYVDDYNIQEYYVGQGLQPILEMEIETAGLYLRTNGVLF